MITIMIDHPIQPKTRPRLGRGGNVYSPSAQAEKGLAWEFRAQAGTFETSEPVALFIEIAYSKGDLDNYLKTICDALQKSSIVKNDKQVVEIHMKKRQKTGLFLQIIELERK